MELKGFLSELRGWFTKYLPQNCRTFTEFKGDLVVSFLTSPYFWGSSNVYLYSLHLYSFPWQFKFVYNKFCRMYGNRNKLGKEIAWFITLLQVRLVLLHELENRSISWKRIEWNNKNWNFDRIVLELKAKGYF